MTSRPSFTSSSDAARYLRTLTFALGGLVTALVTMHGNGYRFGMVEAATTTSTTISAPKSTAAAPFDIAFVGDSSLGNSQSTQRFGELSGATTVNLALNGSYGSGGAYNMVRKVLERHTPQPDRRDAVDRHAARELKRFRVSIFSAEPAQLLTTSPHSQYSSCTSA